MTDADENGRLTVGVGGPPPRRTLPRVLSGAASITALFVVVGFTMGIVGFGQLDPGSSFFDRLYSSLQLLVLAGPNGLGSEALPPLLSWGRFVAAAGLAGTVFAFFQRLGSERADNRKAKRAKGHVVVIGNSDEARAIARARVRSSTRPRPDVFLVGAFDERTTQTLRSSKVRVVRSAGFDSWRSVLAGAVEVVIAEDDDGWADARFRTVLSALESSSAAQPVVAVRVLVRETDLAKTMRAEGAMNRRRHFSVSALSVVEAASQRLTSEEWFPEVPRGDDTHLVIIGAGELARETAISAVERRVGRSYRTVLDLWASDGGRWCDEVKERVAGGSVIVGSHQWTGGSNRLAQLVASGCGRDGFTDQVFIVGIADSASITVSRHLERWASAARVVSVQHVASHRGAASVQEVGGVRHTTVGDLLSDIELWDIDQQLARQLMETVTALSELPGVEQRLSATCRFVSLPLGERLDGAGRMASSIRLSLAEAGLMLEPTESFGDAPVLMTDVLVLLRDGLLKCFAESGIPVTSTSEIAILLSVLQDLPEMLRRCGFSLEPSNPDATSMLMSASMVDLLAERAHQSYREIALATGTNASVRDWAELGPDEVESNRAQIRDIPIKLLRLGYRVVPASTPGSVLPELTVEDVEALAWYEHLRWMHSRVINGWEYGAERDNRRRLHPLIVAYEDLPEHQWEFDRGPVRLLPELLQMADLAVIPIGD